MSIIMVNRSILILAVAATLALAACSSGSNSADSSNDTGSDVIGDVQVATDSDPDDTSVEQVTTDTDSGNTGEQINTEPDAGSEGTSVTSNENSSAVDETENNTVAGDTDDPGGTLTIDGTNLFFGTDPLRMTLGSGGSEISDAVTTPSISDDGRFILFGTFAPNVVADDIGEFSDVYLRDTLTGVVTQISVGVDGSQGNNHSQALDISANGRFLLFSSFAQNLIPAGARGNSQLYLHDSQTSVTTLVSAGTDGRGGLTGTASGFIAADGEMIVYQSTPRFVGEPATISIYHRSTGETRNINLSQVLQTAELIGPDIHAVTPDGRFILLSCCVTEPDDDDVNVYTYNTTNDVVDLLPGAGDRSTDPTISDDGQIIVYGKGRLLNRSDGSVKELNQNFFRTLSPDGRWLPYIELDAEFNSVPFLRDNLNDIVYQTNRRIDGFTGNGNNAYLITARSDLGVTDTNDRFDVYLYDFPLSDLP